VTLKEGGKNTILIQAFDDEWSPNFDRITIHPLTPDSDETGIQVHHEPGKSSNDHAYYSIDGRKLPSQPAAGVFVHQGKKHFISSH